MHIAFLTLFLGLTSGVQPFELSVSGPAASVEILVDGAVAQRLQGPPWKGLIDFGPDLAPHELVARALDASGREIARARQVINLLRPPAEVEIALEGPRTVRLSWERLTHEPPVQTTLSLDGQELRLDDQRRASLPDYDPGSTHVLTAELRFPSNVVARKDLIFGGEAGETHTELTAVPVEGLKSKRAAGDLQGWFVKDDGTPLRVTAVEDAPAELYLVRVPEAEHVRSRLRPSDIRPPSPLALLGKGDLLRIVSVRPKAFQGDEARSSLFDLSQHFPGVDGLRRFLISGTFPLENAPARTADAVAVAGLHAMGGAHRRAVVLVVDESKDASLYDPTAVRRYLSAIRVPLFVWTLTDAVARRRLWGETAYVYDTPSLEHAFQKVRTALERQRIVWIEGRHLPQSIRLSDRAPRGVAIAGAVKIPPAPPRKVSPGLDLVTTFPSLIPGDQTLQVATRGSVSAVEILLDGKSLGKVSRPLWTGTLPLGPGLVPHELVVRALGPQGEELDRSRQWINLPAAEIGLALEGEAVRVSWTTQGAEPKEVAVAFDGKPLEVKDGLAVLPAYDPARVHLVTATLTFPREVEVRQAAALEGGVLLALTPVPVRLEWGRKLPPLEKLQGKLTARGEPLRVVAAESGPAELYVVRVPALGETRTLLQPRIEAQDGFVLSLLSLARDDDGLRLVSPWPQVSPAPAAWPGLFNLLPRTSARRDGGLLYPLAEMDLVEEHKLKEMRVADAVAVAGLQAAVSNRRRAVLLVLGHPFEDRSRLDPAAVRAYLGSLGVPLYVWNLTDPFPAWEAEEFEHGLKTDLDLQRILWVEGRHLAREIRLAPDVADLELLAR